MRLTSSPWALYSDDSARPRFGRRPLGGPGAPDDPAVSHRVGLQVYHSVGESGPVNRRWRWLATRKRPLLTYSVVGFQVQQILKLLHNLLARQLHALPVLETGDIVNGFRCQKVAKIPELIRVRLECFERLYPLGQERECLNAGNEVSENEFRAVPNVQPEAIPTFWISFRSMSSKYCCR
jgi:hypothetical protein